MFCCCDKRTAHVAVALISLLFFIFQILRGVEILLAEDWGFRGPYAAPIALFVLSIIGICVTALDGYGILQERASFMMPFLVYMIVLTIVVGLAALVYILAMDTKFSEYRTKSSSFIVGCFLAVGLFVYFCTVISSHIKEVKTKSLPRVATKHTEKPQNGGTEHADNVA